MSDYEAQYRAAYDILAWARDCGELERWFKEAVVQAVKETTPQPAPTAAEDGLREFVESIVNAMGPYPDLNGHPIISAAYAALRSKPEASGGSAS